MKTEEKLLKIMRDLVLDIHEQGRELEQLREEVEELRGKVVKQ